MIIIINYKNKGSSDDLENSSKFFLKKTLFEALTCWEKCVELEPKSGFLVRAVGAYFEDKNRVK